MEKISKIRQMATDLTLSSLGKIWEFFSPSGDGSESGDLFSKVNSKPWETLVNGGQSNSVMNDPDVQLLVSFSDVDVTTLVDDLPHIPSFEDLDPPAIKSNKNALIGLYNDYTAAFETLRKMKKDALEALANGNMKPNENATHLRLIELIDERLLSARNCMDLTDFYLRNIEVAEKIEKQEGAK